ncbi:MAG: hypothetical protein FWG14_13515 [Peptococcaceae bacterium]|nr:hypothetical protein [Peptococcaceae bacterium]
MLTEERALALTEILNADEARAEILLRLEPEEALKQINAQGNDFTLDELREYGGVVNIAAKQTHGELDADSLDNVAGGIAWGAALAAVPWKRVGKCAWAGVQAAVKAW